MGKKKKRVRSKEEKTRFKWPERCNEVNKARFNQRPMCLFFKGGSRTSEGREGEQEGESCIRRGGQKKSDE